MPQLQLRTNLTDFFKQAMQAAIPRARREALKAVEHSLIQKGLPLLRAAFSSQAYYKDGVRTGLGLFSTAWAKFKKRKGLDIRRGWAFRILGPTIGSVEGIKRINKEEIEYSQARATRKSPAIDYLDFYAKSKAPGLGGLSTSAYKDARGRAIAAFVKVYEPIARSAGLPGSSLLKPRRYKIRVIRR